MKTRFVGSALLAGAVWAHCHVCAAAPSVSIVSAEDSVNTHALPMIDAFVYVKIESTIPLGRATLRLDYDASRITFLGAEATNQLVEWEYFTWRHSLQSECGDSCHGTLELRAIADLNGADTVIPNLGSLELSGQQIRVRFRTSSNLNELNRCVNIDFLATSCGDAILGSATGDTVFVSQDWPGVCEPFPTATVVPILETTNGRVCIEDPDGEGDINLDARINEVGDFILFNRYMIYGDDALDPIWREVQLINLDTDDDGVPGTVADLHHLLRVIASGTRFPAGGYYK